MIALVTFKPGGRWFIENLLFLGDSLNQRPPGYPKQASLAVFDYHVVAGAAACAERADLKHKDHEFLMVFLVAGAGLEPATFGL